MSIASTIQSMQTNVENAYDALEDKGATIPANKNIANLVDAITSIPAGSGLEKYHITQTIDGNNCTLAIVDYNSQSTDNYLVGVVVAGDNQKIYIVEE